MLCEWGPHKVPILSEAGGRVCYKYIVEDETMRIEIDPSGHARRTIVEHKGDLHPQILIEDGEGHILACNDIPEGAGIEVAEGQMITAGTLLARTPREVDGTHGVTGGLPRVTELFEARRPEEPAVTAEIDDNVELLDEERRDRDDVQRAVHEPQRRVNGSHDVPRRPGSRRRPGGASSSHAWRLIWRQTISSGPGR